jgi:hypothetical protein
LDDHEDVAAVAAVAAMGPALGHMRFMAEADMPVAAFAGADRYLGLINELSAVCHSEGTPLASGRPALLALSRR